MVNYGILVNQWVRQVKEACRVFALSSWLAMLVAAYHKAALTFNKFTVVCLGFEER
jgi:hypothetical protein